MLDDKTNKKVTNNNHANDSMIIIFTRFPREGEAKTRLIPRLGELGAMLLHKKMAEFTIREAMNTCIPVQIHYAGGTKEEMQTWLNDILCRDIPNRSILIPQGEGDLGERMKHAFEHTFTSMFQHSQGKTIKKVILMGSDCPDNRTENMFNALNLLDCSPCVIGPSVDGGYYLVGLKAIDLQSSQVLYPQLFANITWSTDTVFQETISRIKQYALLPTLSDVDYPIDIPTKISVIIPTLNEESNLRKCLELLSTGFNIEVIVVDGASSDDTCKVAEEFGAIVWHTPKDMLGRASQIDIGSRMATGEILLLLHADSSLPPLWDKQVREVMQNKENTLGYFTFAIDEDFWGKNIITWGTNIRANFLRLPYGDQGLFVRAKDFETWEMEITPILEDVFLVKKARQYGKICCTHTKLYTSGRRWLKHGVIRTLLINQGVLFASYLGMDLCVLRDAYRQGKNPLFILVRDVIKKGFNIWKK